MASMYEKPKPKNKHESGLASVAILTTIGAGILGAVAYDQIKSESAIKGARQEMEAVNTPKAEVIITSGNTIHAVASEAVNSGYIRKGTDINRASGFLLEELNRQLHEKGSLAPDQNLTFTNLPTEVPLEVPASWENLQSNKE